MEPIVRVARECNPYFSPQERKDHTIERADPSQAGLPSFCLVRSRENLIPILEMTNIGISGALMGSGS